MRFFTLAMRSDLTPNLSFRLLELRLRVRNRFYNRRHVLA